VLFSTYAGLQTALKAVETNESGRKKGNSFKETNAKQG